MPNDYFDFRQFRVIQAKNAMKVTTDGCLFGAWVSSEIDEEKHILDIGAGTGLLMLMIAQQSTQANITGIEINSEACDEATENCERSKWKDRLKLINSDAIEFLSGKKFDAIVSNPPFFMSDLRSPDEFRNKAMHDSGLNYETLIKVIEKNLSADGCFYLLLPYRNEKSIRRLLNESGFGIEKIVFVKQTPKHDYFRLMIKGRRVQQSAEITVDEILIKDEDGSYSDQFAELLKPYYL